LKEFIDSHQSLLIEVIRRFVLKDLLDKHLAQRDGQLIDQTSDSQRAICDHIPVPEENLADIKGHPCFLVGTGHFFQFIYDRSESDMSLSVLTVAQGVKKGMGEFLHVAVVLAFLQLLHDNNALLI